MRNKIISIVIVSICLYAYITFNSGCAQIGAPTGGSKDSIAPVLIKASPDTNALNFRDTRITLTFDEYVEVQDIQTNVLVSPLQKSNPTITNNLRTITIRLRDTLLPNTTYTINFGNAIKDINEGNVYPNFTYVFSTGSTIDSLSVEGKVLMAETGVTDSTLNILLYRNLSDSAVQKLRPDYIARVRGDGSFRFDHLPAGIFNIYALKDGDGGKTYSSKTELFAFLDSPIVVNGSTAPATLFAYGEEAPRENSPASVLRAAVERRLRYTSNLSGEQDLLEPLSLTFNNRLKLFDTSLLNLTDTNSNKIAGARATLDSTQKIVSFAPTWKPGETYMLIVNKDAVQDSTGNKLAKSDTLRFLAKTDADYGRITIRFKNYDASRHPVLQFVIAGAVRFSFPLTSAEWTNKRFTPGEYELRILYDSDRNGLWTPGNYSKKLQPEKVIALPQKIAIRADWDNERDITL